MQEGVCLQDSCPILQPVPGHAHTEQQVTLTKPGVGDKRQVSHPVIPLSKCKECRAAVSTHPEGRSCLFQGRSLWTLPHLRARKGESLLIQLKAWEYQINGEKGSFASHSLLWINRAKSELISTATAGGRQQQAGGGGSLVWHKEQTIAVTHVHPHFKISEY